MLISRLANVGVVGRIHPDLTQEGNVMQGTIMKMRVPKKDMHNLQIKNEKVKI